MTGLTGFVDTGRILGGLDAQGTFAQKGTDGKFYFTIFSGNILAKGQVYLGCCDTGAYSLQVDSARYNTDIASLTGAHGKTFSVANCVPIKNTEYILVLAEDLSAGVGNPAYISGIYYRIDGPATLVPVYKMTRIATDHTSIPSGAYRGCFGAMMFNNKIYAGIAVGTFFPLTMHSVFINGLEFGADDEALITGSWDDKLVEMPFQPNIDDPGASVDYFGTTRMSFVKAKDDYTNAETVGAFYVASSTNIPFTKISADGSTNGVTNRAADFSMPFFDWDKTFSDDADAQVSNEYACPSTDGDWGEEISWCRTSTGSGDTTKFRIRRHAYNRFTDEITFLDETTFTYTVLVSGYPQFAFSSRDGADVNVAAVASNHRYYVFGTLAATLSAPTIEVPLASYIVGATNFMLDVIAFDEQVSEFPKKHFLETTDTGSEIHIGPFRYAEQKAADETSSIDGMVVGVSESRNGEPVQTDDWLLSDEHNFHEDFNGDGSDDEEEEFEDWGYIPGFPDLFNTELMNTDDGRAPQYQGVDPLTTVEEFDAARKYETQGFSSIMHRVRFYTSEAGHKFYIKMIDIAGLLTGRHR
jgi:hypothetical protein